MQGRPRIAICLFGIARSLDKTATSIEENVIAQAAKLGEIVKLAHFFDQPVISNLRTGEHNVAVATDEESLPLDQVKQSKPETQEILEDIRKLSVYGDAWCDKFASLRNLVHQLHSLRSVSVLEEQCRPDIVAFIRPDLNYHDSLHAVFRKAVRAHRSGASVVFAPDWQRWGGVNDRFAIAVGREAARAYGNRISYAQEFCQSLGRPLHSERLLAFALERSKVKVVPIPHRASRVRANGIQSWEDFDRFLPKAVQWQLDNRFKHRLRPLHRILSLANQYSSRLLWGDRYINIDPPEEVVARSRTEEEALRSGRR